MLNRDLLQLNNSMNSLSEGLKALELARTLFWLCYNSEIDLQQCMMGWII